MKMFEFSLQRVLDAKLAVEESLEIRLGNAQRHLDVSLRKLDSIRERRAREARRVADLKGRHVSARELASGSGYLQWVEKEMARQTDEVRQREKEVDAVRREWMVAMKERKTFERLKEKERLEWRYEQNRKEQKDLDDLTSAVFYRQRQRV